MRLPRHSTKQSHLKYSKHLEYSQFIWNTIYLWITCAIAFQSDFCLSKIFQVLSTLSLGQFFIWLSLTWPWTSLTLTWDVFHLQLTDSSLWRILFLQLYWLLVHWSGSQTTNTRLNSLFYLWQSDQFGSTIPLLLHWFHRTNVHTLNPLILLKHTWLKLWSDLLRPEHRDELLSVTLRRTSRNSTIFCFFVFVPSSF